MQSLNGIHHVTAITSSAEKIYEFFTYILGMRLVKKTVNQDDIETYHLFFADDMGSPGTDMTFFDFKHTAKAQKGSDEIAKTAFRVPSDEALDYWVKRFNHHHVKHYGIETLFGHKILYFEDFDTQAYALISDEKNQSVKAGNPWKKGPVPEEYAIYGLGPIFLNVRDLDKISDVLVRVLKMRKTQSQPPYHLFEMGKGGHGGSVIVHYTPELDRGLQGYGSVHHVAFRIDDKAALDAWTTYFNRLNAPNSGYVDRFYFKSLYTRLYPNILFELATEGPGFIDDQESYETLGETLALPPALESQRNYVEKTVRAFDTKRSNKSFKKTYFDHE